EVADGGRRIVLTVGIEWRELRQVIVDQELEAPPLCPGRDGAERCRVDGCSAQAARDRDDHDERSPRSVTMKRKRDLMAFSASEARDVTAWRDATPSHRPFSAAGTVSSAPGRRDSPSGASR